MNLLQWFAEKFGNNRVEHSATPHQHGINEFGGGQLTYRPDLIPQLEKEHRQLEEALSALSSAHDAGDYDECVSLLRRFTTILRAHLLKENTLLYVYLRKLLEYDEESLALVNAMRVEMQAIGRVLNQLVTDYTSSPWDADMRRRLAFDLERIRQALDARIGNEESALYPLYLPESALAEDRSKRKREAGVSAN
jgi:hypothetical protein